MISTRTAVLLGATATGVAVLAAVRLASPAAGAAFPEALPPLDCHDVVSVAWPGDGEELGCLSELSSLVARAAKRAGCQLVHLPPLRAGERLRIDASCRVSVSPIEGATLLSLGLPIDLNRAGAQDLAALPGIGPARAAAIVRDREERGAYLRPADLTRVKGIGPGTVESLQGMVSVGGGGAP